MTEADGLSVPTTLENVCHPSRMALIVYDMQVGIVSQIPNGAEIVAKVKTVLDAARAGGYRVFFTRHMWLPSREAGVGQLRRAMIWRGATGVASLEPPFAPGSEAWQIVPELAPTQGEAVVDKITMSCFEGTFLNLAMRDAKLEAFAIVGIALEIGIEPSVRHACDLNYIPVVVVDACGYRDPDAYRRSLDGFTFSGETLQTNTQPISELMARPLANVPR